MRALTALVIAMTLTACAPASPPPAAEPAPPTAAPHSRPETPGEPMHPPALPISAPLPSEPGEAGVRAFVKAFMETRQRGDEARARDFLSPTALEQFASRGGAGGLSLTGGAEGRSFTRWELLSLNAADANSWEVKVRLFYPGGTEGDVQLDETLFIGPGPDAGDTQRVWIVRGATES